MISCWKTIRGYLISFAFLLYGFHGMPQEAGSDFCDSKGQLHYSAFDSWYFRAFTESELVSGETIQLYKIGKVSSSEDVASLNLRDHNSPWETTNFCAKIGLDIGNTCVFPDKTEDGYCCRLETHVQQVNALGINLNVLVSGALFLGAMEEPVKSIKNPLQKMNHGIPFSGKPQKIHFSYKYVSGETRIKSIYVTKQVDGADQAELCLILQKRWEDEKGNVFATRIGGTRNFFEDTNGKWINDTTLTIYYGDITHESFYDPKTMALIPEVSELYVKNSKGKMVPLTEIAWGSPDDIPTHMVLYFASSYQGIEFIGSPESVLWVDNVELIY